MLLLLLAVLVQIQCVLIGDLSKSLPVLLPVRLLDGTAVVSHDWSAYNVTLVFCPLLDR